MNIKRKVGKTFSQVDFSKYISPERDIYTIAGTVALDVLKQVLRKLYNNNRTNKV